ncbi:Homocysteine S-methyltransferase 2 [Psilocybe cubensis]|uniref:Homocysteine S-methyltransferase 2 n=1 Tax=Psilocybe cubensis TaxID=181762 RepID=A0ACB8GKG7_PSICU|nr:Homocysteine S-methyltransferase 2 [Psilocybe cubensis]KAH9475950.1 Homocysteine S-methyltransferase 2 [Psilocybe cubensis]
MISFAELVGNSTVVLLDGGLGTTLEDYVGLEISQSPLWSAQPIASASEEIMKAHLLFLRAGAKILSTSTYQCSVETFQAAGFDSELAKSLMLKSVLIATKAREIFEAESIQAGFPLQNPTIIALSLGPFGAILKPTQEFRGFYPPPYGPLEYSDDHINHNSFKENESKQEADAIDALTQFHYERLLVYASSVNTWKSIDCIAFETVPLKREVIAIRHAIQLLHTWIVKRGGEMKPWWISCVFPDGNSPAELLPDGPKISIDGMLDAAFSEMGESNGRLPTPSGFGINCTKPEYLPALAASTVGYFKAHLDKLISKPWLIIYPNGNDVYDEETRSWVGKSQGSHINWANEVGNLVMELPTGNNVIGGVVVGGCCKTGPEHISSLRSKLQCFPVHL